MLNFTKFGHFSIFAFRAPIIPIIPWARATFPALGAQGATFRILTRFSDSSHFDLNFSIFTKFLYFLWKRRPGVISSLGVEGNDPLSRVTFAQTWKGEKVRKSNFLMKKHRASINTAQNLLISYFFLYFITVIFGAKFASERC